MPGEQEERARRREGWAQRCGEQGDLAAGEQEERGSRRSAHGSEQGGRGGGEQGGRQRASRRSAAADRRASRRSPWGDRRGWGKRGEEKEGDDMWGPHVSEWREMIVAGAF